MSETSHKNIYLVLSRNAAPFSLLVRLLKGDEYTHAALAFDRDLHYMFSFGLRHYYNPLVTCFKRERFDRDLYGMFHSVPGVILELQVTEQQYNSALQQMENFLVDSSLYAYNYFGLMANLFHISKKRKYKFFCSEFVYHILYESGICDLQKPRGLVRPQDLLSIDGRVVYQGNLKEYANSNKSASQTLNLRLIAHYLT